MHLEDAWEGRVIAKPGLARILGSAVGAGIGRHYATREGGPEAARNATLYALQGAKDRGLLIHPNYVVDAAGLGDVAAKGVEKYIANDPIPPSWIVEDIERDLGEAYGRARIDLGVILPSGERMPLDIKTKRTLDARYRDRTLAEFRQSWQMMHYAWAYGAVTQQSIMQFGIILVVLEPRINITLDLTTIDQETLDTWLEGAKRVWAQIENEEEGERPWMAAEHWDRYGQCPMYEVCFDYRYNETLIEREYVRREKR
jgi:hypothetical protein